MEDLYELIEAYLDGSLPEPERRAVEQRIAADEDFRREVALHRSIREEFSDPRGLALQGALSEIMREPLPATEAPPTPKAKGILLETRKWWFAVAAVLLLGIGVWYFLKEDNPTAPPQIAEPEKKPIPKPDVPIAQTPSSQPPTSNPATPQPRNLETSKPRNPETLHLAANFEKNATLEAFRNIRSQAVLKMTVPKDSATVFTPNSAGKTRLRFVGTLDGIRPEAIGNARLNLLIFNNKDAQKPLLTLPLTLNAAPENAAIFDLPLIVDWPRGLYYFRVEEPATGEVLAVERFFIGRR